ncbi:MAG: peptidoglycan bridge formation glycyltransferase FemA/FemB family protein [Candidatus Omnitrophica bacterium]|nr:peptidoglycan bridge formation glycyltransferase FemA/FemB family protein [Candidatus Omnitrophota bacterium]
MITKEIAENRWEEWDNFVAESPNGHFFQSFEFGEIRSTLGWEPIRVVVEDEGGIKAAISILKMRIPLLNKCIFYARERKGNLPQDRCGHTGGRERCCRDFERGRFYHCREALR